MSRDFIENLPEEFRSLYQNAPITPDPRMMKFQELLDNDNYRKKVRANSKLYKLMGEDIFTIMRPNGELVFDVSTFVPEVILGDLFEQAKTTRFMIDELSKLGNEITEYEITKNGEPTTAVLQFYADKLIAEFTEDEASLYQARSDIILKFGFYDSSMVELDEKYFNKHKTTPSLEGEFSSGRNKLLSRERYRDLQGIQRMLRMIRNKPPSTQHQYYFLSAVKPNPLFKAMLDIRWSRDYR